MAQGGASAGGQQKTSQGYIVFDNFEKMNTQAARTGLPNKQLAWLENLQPLAENKLQVVPAAAGAPFLTLPENITLAFYATINGTDYAICFTTVGGGWYISLNNGTFGQFAADGTFSQAPDCTTYQGERILINDSLSGYCSWDGMTFYRQGTLSANIVVTGSGFGYATPPSVTIFDQHGNTHGATAVSQVFDGGVIGVQLTNPGTGWTTTSVVNVSFGSTTGSGATFSVTMGTSFVTAALISYGGAFNAGFPGAPFTAPLTVSGGGGSGAAVSAVIQRPNSGWYASSVSVIAGGSGYTGVPSVVYPTPPSNGTLPTFTAYMGDISVASIAVTAGGSGYPPSATIPLIFSGGATTANATGTCTTNSSGVVISASLTSGGAYPFGGSPGTIQVAAGSGAAASAQVWPFVPKGTTLAVFQGRVWLGGGTLLQWTGTGANANPGVTYDDFDPANAAGSLQITDADLVHQISALRSLNNYLWIVGDQSVKQIGNISVSATSPPITLFNILTLSSDQGTIWPKSCISYNRIFLFANPNGIFGVFGSTVQKVSDDLDGVFALGNFAQQPQGAILDLNSKHNAVFLIRYNDPVAGTRSLLLMFDGKRWWLANQGTGIVTILTYPQLASDLNTLFGSLAQTDLTQLFADPTTAMPFKLVSALSHEGNPVQGKRIVRAGFTADASGPGQVIMSSDTEVFVNPGQVGPTNTWNVSATSGLVGGTNDANNAPVGGAGIYLGTTITGTLRNFILQNAIIEYQETALWKGA